VSGAPDVPESWGSPRSKVVTWYDPAISAGGLAGRSGLEYLQALMDGALPPPPIALLLGMRPVRLEAGLVVFECEPDESVYNPLGLIHGGLACTLADTVAGCAVQSTLGSGFGFTSIDIAVSYLRPVSLESGTLTATGRVVKPGRRVAFAEAQIHDGSRSLVATATSSCLVFAL